MIEFVNDCQIYLIKTNASDLDVARAAWVSQLGDQAREKDAYAPQTLWQRLLRKQKIPSKRVEGLINYLYKNLHLSPFEHGSYTFFADVPFFVAREFHRHRTMSYNEISARYTELKPRFYIPPRNRPLIQTGKIGAYVFEPGSDEQYNMLVEEFKNAAEEDWARYQRLLDNNIAKEVARDTLPLNMMTQFYATVNPRNLMAFLKLRTADNALYEIREFTAKKMEQHFKQTMPLTWKAWDGA